MSDNPKSLYGVFRVTSSGMTPMKWFPTKEEAEAYLKDSYADEYFFSRYGDEVYIILEAASSAKKIAQLTN